MWLIQTLKVSLSYWLWSSVRLSSAFWRLSRSFIIWEMWILDDLFWMYANQQPPTPMMIEIINIKSFSQLWWGPTEKIHKIKPWGKILLAGLSWFYFKLKQAWWKCGLCKIKEIHSHKPVCISFFHWIQNIFYRIEMKQASLQKPNLTDFKSRPNFSEYVTL